ncbi:hypothetical protein GCM10022226_03360 [Sphaerisporangium flaviroseum]|uniref:Secreted protein n=1 Tax=Sphaerisporangium flaviroseum TaxID=509199 RepID=A0ABP7H8B9_9ACTN
MLKRLLFAVTLAASTLLVTGTAQASGPTVCASAQHVTPHSTMASQCTWREDCYYCYSYRTGSWEQQYCNGGSDG